MKCRDLMKTDVVSVRAEQTLSDAALLMRDHNVGFLPVISKEGVVLGTLTDRDIVVRGIADGGTPDLAVLLAMTHEVVSCRPEDPLRLAEERMAAQKKSRIVCCDDHGCLLGVISLSDISRCEEPGEANRLLRDVSDRGAEARP